MVSLEKLQFCGTDSAMNPGLLVFFIANYLAGRQKAS